MAIEKFIIPSGAGVNNQHWIRNKNQEQDLDQPKAIAVISNEHKSTGSEYKDPDTEGVIAAV